MACNLRIKRGELCADLGVALLISGDYILQPESQQREYLLGAFRLFLWTGIIYCVVSIDQCIESVDNNGLIF